MAHMKVYWLERAASDVPSDNNWLSPSELARLEGMRIPKRRADWRLGRWTAKNAVAAYLKLACDSIALSGIEIRSKDSGAPEVFLANEVAAVSISLSHRSEVAACAIAPSGTRLGFDLEVIEPRSQAFLEDYFTADEQQLIASASSTDRDKVVNLFWSAKESALKALDVGLRLDTRRVSVSSMEGLSLAAETELRIGEHAPDQTESTPSVWNPLRVSFGDYIFQGWWQQTGVLLRTMVSAPACDQLVLLTTAPQY